MHHRWCLVVTLSHAKKKTGFAQSKTKSKSNWIYTTRDKVVASVWSSSKVKQMLFCMDSTSCSSGLGLCSDNVHMHVNKGLWFNLMPHVKMATHGKGHGTHAGCWKGLSLLPPSQAYAFHKGRIQRMLNADVLRHCISHSPLVVGGACMTLPHRRCQDRPLEKSFAPRHSSCTSSTPHCKLPAIQPNIF